MMEKLSFEDFLKLPIEEKCIRYKDLSNHDKFLARMSYTGGAVATGEKFDMSKEDNTWLEEEEKKWQKDCKELHKQRKELEEKRKNNL